MSDWRDDEYKRLSGLKPTLLSKKWLKEHTRVVHTDEPVPDAIDWRSKDFVTEVKNQGDDCGVCWSFATTGLLEGAYKRHTGKLVSLSEQNLIDCVGHACEGNSINAGTEYVIRNNGIDTEANYPFTEASTHEVDSCRYQSNQALLTDLKQIVSAPPDDEEQLKILVAKYGPIAVAFNADGLSYKVSDGVHYNSTCNQGVVNHALLVVGYGRDNKKEMDFWIVKNSWGVTWGDGGYFLAARNQGNNCFIAQSAIYALFENEQ